jgi:hypothetical protein
LASFVKCGSEGFFPTSVVKKYPQVAPLSRGRVFKNIYKIFTSQKIKLTQPITNLIHIYSTICRTFLCLRRGHCTVYNILYEHSISNIEKITGAIRKENRIVRWSVGRQYGK